MTNRGWNARSHSQGNARSRRGCRGRRRALGVRLPQTVRRVHPRFGFPGRQVRQLSALRPPHRRRFDLVHRQAAPPAGQARAVGARSGPAPVRDLLLGRRRRGRQRPLPALPRPGEGARRVHDLLPVRAVSAARVQEAPLRPAEQPARRLRHRLPHERAHQGHAHQRPPRLARRARDRHPLQRPLLLRVRHRRQLDARAVEERDPAGEGLREGVAQQHRLERPALPALRLRQGTRRRAHPVCSARTTCCPPQRSSAGATTPPRPAAARSGP